VEPTEKQEPQLTIPDEGIDPTVPAGVDSNRIAEVNALGPVDPHAAVGVIGISETPPLSVQPPPGSGEGAGGAPELNHLPGTGGRDRAWGGMRGLRHVPGGYLHRSGGARERTALTRGGSKESEAAVARGLLWLALHQAPQGYWALDQFHLHARAKVNSTQF